MSNDLGFGNIIFYGLILVFFVTLAYCGWILVREQIKLQQERKELRQRYERPRVL